MTTASIGHDGKYIITSSCSFYVLMDVDQRCGRRFQNAKTCFFHVSSPYIYGAQTDRIARLHRFNISGRDIRATETATHISPDCRGCWNKIPARAKKMSVLRAENWALSLFCNRIAGGQIPINCLLANSEDRPAPHSISCPSADADRWPYPSPPPCR